MGIPAVILGASGYTGAELLRTLVRHPVLEPVATGSRRGARQPLRAFLPHLGDLVDVEIQELSEAAAATADVCFSCLPSGVFRDLAPDVRAELVIDLSDDHRSAEGWTYGLTELNRAAVASSRRVANPGCYPTAMVLALAPFGSKGLIEGPIVVDAISGTSGAGRSPAEWLLHSEVGGGVAAYGNTRHRHVPEMRRGLSAFGGVEAEVSFTPHLAPIPRGLLVTARAHLTTDVDDGEVLDTLLDAYDDEPFVEVVKEWPATKHVLGSNRAAVSARVDRACGFLIASGAIDNLGKGAAGQAVQNANLLLGLEETTGLDVAGVWP